MGVALGYLVNRSLSSNICILALLVVVLHVDMNLIESDVRDWNVLWYVLVVSVQFALLAMQARPCPLHDAFVHRHMKCCFV